MSRETAATLTTIMEAVVERGTGKDFAKMEDYSVAGKTGTAEKALSNGRGYSGSDFFCSFVGFVPSRKPALTILVVIDSPHGKNRAFGATVAAPAFKRIAQAAMLYLGVQPSTNPAEPIVIRPDRPAPTLVSGSSVPLTIVPWSPNSVVGQMVLPELRGMSGREALRVLARLGVAARVVGDGIVVEQDPGPGASIEPGALCRLGLSRSVSAGITP